MVLSSEGRRDPLVCIDPPLTVRLTFSEGQKQGEVSFREGQEAPAPVKLQTLTPFTYKQGARARLSEFGLAPYLRSEGGLRGGGLSEYPRRRRSPSEAKYGAKKGNSERG